MSVSVERVSAGGGGVGSRWGSGQGRTAPCVTAHEEEAA